MKRKEITLFKIEVKLSMLTLLGDCLRKSQVQEQNLATILLDRDHIATFSRMEAVGVWKKEE